MRLATGARGDVALWLALGFGLLFPTGMAWAEFVLTARAGAGPNRATQFAYAGGKLVQFAWPVVCVVFIERRFHLRASLGRKPHDEPSWGFRPALALGIGFGLLVAAGMLALYFGALRDSAVFAASPGQVHDKLREFGLDSPGGFALFAGFVTLVHSLLEEYYWRWFVFGRLRRLVSLGWAVALSSAGFTAFHIFPLETFLPGHFWTAALPFAGCVAVGGAFWAWLYDRGRSLLPPWVSHALVDAALFVIGYDLFFVRGF